MRSKKPQESALLRLHELDNEYLLSTLLREREPILGTGAGGMVATLPFFDKADRPIATAARTR